MTVATEIVTVCYVCHPKRRTGNVSHGLCRKHYLTESERYKIITPAEKQELEDLRKR